MWFITAEKVNLHYTPKWRNLTLGQYKSAHYSPGEILHCANGNLINFLQWRNLTLSQ